MSVLASPERPRPARPRGSVPARLALVGVALYVAVDMLLAFLRPGYSLVRNAESDYGRGPWAWVMDLNFLLRCALTLSLVVALRRGATGVDRRTGIGMVLLVVWAACSGLLALFPDDLPGQPVHGTGTIHLALAFIAFTAVVAGTVVLSVGRAFWARHRATRSVRLAVAVAGGACYLLLAASVRHPHPPIGLYERTFLAIELAWISLTALDTLRRRSGPGPSGARTGRGSPAGGPRRCPSASRRCAPPPPRRPG